MDCTTMNDLKAQLETVAERVRMVRKRLSHTIHKKTMLLNKLKLITELEEQLQEKLHEESLREENMLKAIHAVISEVDLEFKFESVETVDSRDKLTPLGTCDKIKCEESISENHCNVDATLRTRGRDVLIAIRSGKTATDSELQRSSSKRLTMKNHSDNCLSVSPLIEQMSGIISQSLISDPSISETDLIAKSYGKKINLAESGGIPLRPKIKIPRISFFVKESDRNQGTSSVKEYRNDRGKFACSVCKKEFEQYRYYKSHVSSHFRPAKYSCSECDLKFLWPNQLKKHKSSHSDQSKLTCSLCDKHMKTSQRYISHMRTHSGERPFECVECGKRFSHKCALKKHQMLHSSMRDHLCSICGKGYVDNCELTKHMLTHSLPHVCDVCDKRFAYSRRLESHRLMHTDECPFVCSVCGHAVRSSKSLTDHLDSHYRVKLHGCKICDRKFQKAGNLKSHIRTHTGEAAFTCRECTMKFRNGYNLKMHMLTHKGIEPKSFTCTECDKKFIGMGFLKAHLISHSSDTPHKCDECEKQYKRPVDLRNHKKKIHNTIVS